MTRFIKLTNMAINMSKIIKIESYSNKHYMYYNNNNIRGLFFISFGTINSSDNFIVICKDKTPIDYEIITKWINQIKPLCEM